MEPGSPTVEDFRALARSSPWRFTTLHFTHRREHEAGGTPDDQPVEAWLDRKARRVTVRSSQGVEVIEGTPYGTDPLDEAEFGFTAAATAERPEGPTLRADGLVEVRPEGWHVDRGDPMWQDYLWTAMLDPVELSDGVVITGVAAVTVRGRPAWAATCRPLAGRGEEWEDGYEPRCSCCPLLDSAVSRLLEYGPGDPTLTDPALPTSYRVHLDVQTGIVVDLAPVDGRGGTVLTNEILSVDEPLNPPR